MAVLRCVKSLNGTKFYPLTENDLQGLKLSAQDVQTQLSRRRPGQSNLTTPVRYDSCLVAFIFSFSTIAR